MDYNTSLWLLHLTKSQREKFIKFGRLLVSNSLASDLPTAMELIHAAAKQTYDRKHDTAYKVASR